MAKQNVTLWIESEIINKFREVVPTKQTSETIEQLIGDFMSVQNSKGQLSELVNAYIPKDSSHKVQQWYLELVEKVKSHD